ncbi:MAG: cytochrome c-type biogenesis protein CcmH [Chloroflexi bacterium]|nr:cytochrome c-type biogenesis protein CcmH [Chloroflexota bacterium]
MKTTVSSTLIPLSAFMLFLAAIMSFTFACASDKELPVLEARAQEINKTVMCPVCPGESIDQSQHPRAKAMRGVVDEKLAEGSTNDEIRQFFVERYGPSVLLEPPREGLNWLVWVVPPVGILAAAVALYFVLRLAVRPSRRTGGSPDDGVALSEAERDDYFLRIEAALASDSDGERPPQAVSDTRDAGEAVAG